MSNYSDSLFEESNSNSSWYKAYHLIKDGAKVLDVGCSSGNFGEVLIAKKNCVVDGLELDSQDAKVAAELLRRVYILNAETDDLSELPQDYDVIYCGDVIEHFVHPVETLKRLKKLLSQDGQIIFSIPNMAYLMIRLQLLEGDFDYTSTGLLDKTHLHFYNLKEIQRVFEAAGFEVDQLDTIKKDYPDAVINDYLKRVDLTPGKAFFKLMHTPEAAAFQFVGSAKIAENPKKPKALQKFGPIDYYQRHYDKVVKDYEDKLKQANVELIRVSTAHDQLIARIDYIRQHPLRFALGKAKRRLKF